MVAAVEVAESPRGLPPGERAFEVYRMVEVDGLSTRAVAQQIGLSQTRVIQLRDAVEQWVARQPSATAGLTKQQRMQAAEYKAGLRLDHLYGLALEAFRQSQGPEIVSEEALGGARVVKTRLSHGNTRYLQMAMRIAAQQSRIPVAVVLSEPEIEPRSESVDELGPPTATAFDEAASPPEEDCSLVAARRAECDVPARERIDAKADPADTSARAAAAAAGASDDFAADFFPVQTDVRPHDNDPLAEPVLTRKQRKRRARMLAALRRG